MKSRHVVEQPEETQNKEGNSSFLCIGVEKSRREEEKPQVWQQNRSWLRKIWRVGLARRIKLFHKEKSPVIEWTADKENGRGEYAGMGR